MKIKSDELLKAEADRDSASDAVNHANAAAEKADSAKAKKAAETTLQDAIKALDAANVGLQLQIKADEAAAIEHQKARKGDTAWIKGPRQGRWRSGVKFGPTPVEVDADDFTETQLKAIQDDPTLKVVPPPE